MKLENFSKSLLDSLSSGLLVLDNQDCGLIWNNAAEEITAIKRNSVEGRPIEKLPELFSDLINPKITSFIYENKKRLIHIEKKIHKVDMGQGKTGLVVMFNDITDLVSARNELETHMMEVAETKDLMEEQAATLAMTLADVDEKTSIIEDQNKKMLHELEMAAELQKSLLPDIYQSFNGVNFASKHKPSIGIGGDLYDVVDLGQGLTGFIIADVSGHGVAAALVASMFKMSFHTHAANVASPKILFHMLNEMMNPLLAEDYITSFYLIVDKTANTITYSNAGHPYPLLYRSKTDEVIELDTDGFFIGMFKNGDYQESTIDISEGDALLMYTDCIIEAQNAQEEEFGRERLIELFHQTIKECQGQDLIDRIEKAASDFNAGERFDDDFTVLLLEFSATAKSSLRTTDEVDKDPHAGEFEEF